MELITIKESHYSSDFAILVSRLESEGVQCTIKDELTSQVLTHLPSMSAKLQVQESDLALVKTIMDEIGDTISIPVIVSCPSCHSKDAEANIRFYEKLKLSLKYAVAQLTLSKYERKLKMRTYICQECGNEFNHMS